MKKIYNENDSFSDTAQEIEREFYHLVKPLFDRWIAEGYSIRELSHLLQGSISEMEIMTVITIKRK